MVRAFDPLLFLIGQREAIERIAATRHAWIVGAVLVLSAGIARNYDHLDLLQQPEWITGPFAASLVSIVFIFVCLAGPLKLKAVGNYPRQLGTFLTLAWMTAPCAWLYGIPVEAMTDIITATKWNIAFLAIVAVWRVILMGRAVSVLTGVPWGRALPLVLAPAAFELMVGSFFKGMSLVQIMGGVRLPPETELLREAASFTTMASLLVCITAVLNCFITKEVAHQPLGRPTVASAARGIGFALVGLALWVLAACPFQPEVRNKHRLERFDQLTSTPETANENPRDHPEPLPVPPK